MGDGGRVHLAAPAVVAASAILGRLGSPAEIAESAAVPA
jgi:homoaconitase/3-isopropylmalate dehydratase large subunit